MTREFPVLTRLPFCAKCGLRRSRVSVHRDFQEELIAKGHADIKFPNQHAFVPCVSFVDFQVWARKLAENLTIIDKERGIFPKSCVGCLEHLAQCRANDCSVGLVREELLRQAEADGK